MSLFASGMAGSRDRDRVSALVGEDFPREMLVPDRVTWTAKGQPTVWLALHFFSET
jgi:hypothetical protein